MGDLSHVDDKGHARMVDVSDKQPSERRARAQAIVRVGTSTAAAIARGEAPKGEVLGTARLAGIQAAKRTDELIPLAHSLPLSFVDVRAAVDQAEGIVTFESEAATMAVTGVEMEALTACAIAALTLYDMAKALAPGIVIERVRLLEKTGGRRDWHA